MDFDTVANRADLIEHARAGSRNVESYNGGRRITVVLPIRTGPAHALVAVASRPDLVAAASIVRDRIWVAAAWAMLAGALCGVLISVVITSRVRRIGAAADAIAGGEFGTQLQPRFPDELGALTQAVDIMRQNLRDSFSDLAGQRDQLRSLIDQLHEGVIAVGDDLTVVVSNTRASTLLGETVREGETLPSPWPTHDLGLLVRRFFAPRRGVGDDAGRAGNRTHLPRDRSPGRGCSYGSDRYHRRDRAGASREGRTGIRGERRSRARTPRRGDRERRRGVARGREERPEELQRFLDLIERQTSRLGRLDTALLTLARAQTGAEPLQVAEVDLHWLLGLIADDMGLEEWQVEVEPDTVALAHEDLLRHAIENLVTNARRHAPGAGIGLRLVRPGQLGCGRGAGRWPGDDARSGRARRRPVLPAG